MVCWLCWYTPAILLSLEWETEAGRLPVFEAIQGLMARSCLKINNGDPCVFTVALFYSALWQVLGESREVGITLFVRQRMGCI